MAPAAKTVSMDFVTLRGAGRTPATDLAFANTVFAPCQVQFSAGGSHAATTAQSDGWLGGDTDLQSGPCAGTAEETATYTGSASAFSLSSRLRAFYPTSISTGDRGNSHPPYCAGTGAALNTINVTNSGANRTLAHELGHILLNSGNHPADTNNLMHPTNTATGNQLTPSQCSTIYSNA